VGRAGIRVQLRTRGSAGMSKCGMSMSVSERQRLTVGPALSSMADNVFATLKLEKSQRRCLNGSVRKAVP